MRIDRHKEGYSFEYPLNNQTDVRVTVSNSDQVTIRHYQDGKQINVVPSPEEKERWLKKVEGIKLKRLKIYSYINKIDELMYKIDLLKEEMLSILDPDEDSDIVVAIKNRKSTEEIQNMLDR